MANTPVAWVTTPAPVVPRARESTIVKTKPSTADAAAPTNPTIPPLARFLRD